MYYKSFGFFLTILQFYACNTIKVNQQDYAWKSFDNTELDQSVDLSKYATPDNRPGQDSNKLVIYCASGGGSRAGAFNIGILMELENICMTAGKSEEDTGRNVLNEIDYFSTVSGGGWGAAAYVSYLYQKQKYSTPVYKDAIQKYNASLKGADVAGRIENYPTFNSFEIYLANRADFRYFKWQIPLIFAGIFGSAKSDMIMTNRLNAGYAGWSYRAYVENKIQPYMLEKSSSFSTNDVDEITLGDIFKPKGQTALFPMQICNTTNIDNYKLVPFTPDRLRYWGVTGYRHYLIGQVALTEKDSTINYDSIPLASAMKASSGIPFGISVSTFPAVKKMTTGTKEIIPYFLHLQDGGIVDQQAMHTAKAILRQHGNITDRKKRIVIIVDASGTGVENNKKFKHQKASRWYNATRVMAPFSTPDAQYALTRERIKLFEDEYNCTVIYLGTEVLLDESLPGGLTQTSIALPSTKKKVEKYYYDCYTSIMKDTAGFLHLTLDERRLLYRYISKYVTTWFSSNGSINNGKHLEPHSTGTAQIMFLAGRGVVQLKRKEIFKAFNN